MPKKFAVVAMLAVLALLAALAVPVAAADDGNDEKKATGPEVTLEGCLSKGGEGAWTLTDAGGGEHKLVPSSTQLAAHEGHKVKVTGEWKGEGEGRHLHVTKLEHVAATC